MIDGLFTGAGLGLAKGGWRSSGRFALYGCSPMALAFALGGINQQLWIDSGMVDRNDCHPVSVITFAIGGTVYSLWMLIGTSTYLVSVITIGISGILAGGILGWFWGRKSGYESVRVVDGSPVR